MARISGRDGYLYGDWYEGFLKFLIVIVPIIIGWLYKYLNNDFHGFVLSLVVSIINQFYSARVSYKDISMGVKRIKIENMVIIVLLAIALVLTLYVWIPSINNNVALTTKDFKIPVILFLVSLSPNVFETFFTFFGKDLGLSRSFKKNSTNDSNQLKIDVTCSNKN